MHIEIKGTHLDVTPSIRKYIEEKIGSLDKVLKRFEEKGGKLVVFVEIARSTRHHQHGKVFYAEAMIQLPHQMIRAECNETDVRAAIDGIKDIVKLEIKKYKEKGIGEKRAERRRARELV